MPRPIGWTAAEIPELTGRTFVVTGANSGIGLEAARALAAHGAHVVLAVRDVARGAVAAAAIGGSSEVRRLDLADLASVRAFAAAVTGEIDVLVNNAGILVPPLGRTADGFELQMGINHLGHFALTNLLLPRITGRVVTVSSTAHRTGTIDFDDLNWTTRRYRRGAAYAQSKLANLLFTLELQRRLEASGSAVIATAAHPGWASTNLGAPAYGARLNATVGLVSRLLANDAAGGAAPTLFAAVAPMPGGGYAGPGRRRELAGPPRLVGRSAAASDPVAAARLWELSEELTGVRYPLAPSPGAPGPRSPAAG